MSNIYDYDERDVLASVLECGVLDVDFFLKEMNSFDLDFDDVKDYAKGFTEKLDVNVLLLSTYNIAGQNFLNEVKSAMESWGLTEDSEDIEDDVIKFFNVDEEELKKLDTSLIDDYEINTYTNFLDSGFDCSLSEYDITDFSEENIKKFIIDTYELEVKDEDDLESSEDSTHLDKIVSDFESKNEVKPIGDEEKSESKKVRRDR